MVDITTLETFVQSSPLPAWLATSKGACVYANLALERLTGLDSDQINQADWPSFLLEEDRAAATASWQSSLAIGTPYRARVRMRGFDGVPPTVELIALGQKVGDGREIWLFAGLRVDSVTQQQPQFEAQLQSTLNMIPAYTWYAAPSGALTFVNERTADYLGLPKDHPLRFGIDIGGEWDAHIPLLHPDDREESRRIWSICLQTGSVRQSNIRIRNAEGGYRWFITQVEPLRASDGTLLYWVGVNLDIEERKQAEFYLAEGERLAHIGSWAFNPAGFDYWSRELFHIHGLNPAQEAPSLEEYLALVHPEDRDFMASLVKRVVEEASGFDVTKRIIRPNGEVRYVRCVGAPVVEDGTLKRIVGTAIDVTEHEVLTQELRRREAYLTEAQRLSHTGSFGWKPDSGEIIWSDETHRIFEYDHTVKPTIDLLAPRVHPEDRADFQKVIDRASAGATGFDHAYRLLLPDGRVKHVHAIAHALQDAAGNREFVGAGIDVSEQWEARAKLEKAFEEIKHLKDQLQNENVALREEIDKASMFEEIVGTSRPLQTVLSRISKVAPTDSSVLITGETGTGKELIARAIHRRSHRSSRAFVSVNCAAIPRDLIASELFGHEKGAFTGATQRRLGRFELAEGGTIFLDEIGELPAETQIALLRVLQEHEFERVGGTGSIQTDVRVIAATNRDLEAAIAAGIFRSDLFYRLNVFPIEMPPLRQRRGDIRLLVEYFIDRYARKAGKSFQSVSKRSLDLLQSYAWPGNIRELQNVIERSVIVCETENFSVDESWLSRRPPTTEPDNRIDISKELSSQEKAIIEAALSECGGRVYGPSGAAAKLGMPRSTLESKIRSLKINKNRFRPTDPAKDS